MSLVASPLASQACGASPVTASKRRICNWAFGALRCKGKVSYALYPDGTNYHYDTGSAWAPSNLSNAQSNAASTLTNGAMQAFSNQFPFGNFWFQALLNSNGVTPCGISWLGAQGTQ